MGRMTAMAFKEDMGRVAGLEAHLSCNWYPPLPAAVRATLTTQFKRHWKDQCHPNVLLRRINAELKKANGEIVGLNTLDKFSEFLLDDEQWCADVPLKPKAEWTKAKSDRIYRSVRDVFRAHDMDKLGREAYRFITLYMGFIAHYDVGGFRDHYRMNVGAFRRCLLSSELSLDQDYNEQYARRLGSAVGDAPAAVKDRAVGAVMFRLIRLARQRRPNAL